MVGTNPTDLLSLRAASRHSRNSATVVKSGMGDEGRAEVDMVRMKGRRRFIW